MAKLTDNTVVVHPETGEPVLLAATGELPDWAAGLVGEHLLEGGSPRRTPAPAADRDEVAQLKARIAELEAAKAEKPATEKAEAAQEGDGGEKPASSRRAAAKQPAADK